MGYRYTVLGAGRQGVAIAYDLILNGKAEWIVLVDQDSERAEKARQRLQFLTGKEMVSTGNLNISSAESVRPALEGSDVVISALPYFLNPVCALAAIDEYAHFCDLGGNTEIVLRELDLSDAAAEVGVSVLPDCGLAPGLSNLFAAKCLSSLKDVETIRARCGGLPQKPRPPLFYKSVFSMEGLINEYSGEAVVLRNGKIQSVPALTENEMIRIPGRGEFEAFVTTGGTSTAPQSFEGKVKNFDYKTLRHPGHFEKIKSLSDLGFFEKKEIEISGTKVKLRDITAKVIQELTEFPLDQDWVVLDVLAQSKSGAKLRLTLIDEGDSNTGFTAMERTTGFPTAVTAFLQAEGKIKPGAHPIEKAVPLDDFFQELKKRTLIWEETSDD